MTTPDQPAWLTMRLNEALTSQPISLERMAEWMGCLWSMSGDDESITIENQHGIFRISVSRLEEHPLKGTCR